MLALVIFILGVAEHAAEHVAERVAERVAEQASSNATLASSISDAFGLMLGDLLVADEFVPEDRLPHLRKPRSAGSAPNVTGSVLDKEEAALKDARDALTKAVAATDAAKEEVAELIEVKKEVIHEKKTAMRNCIRTIISFVVGGLLGKCLPGACSAVLPGTGSPVEQKTLNTMLAAELSRDIEAGGAASPETACRGELVPDGGGGPSQPRWDVPSFEVEAPEGPSRAF